jgi:hypothetical protein
MTNEQLYALLKNKNPKIRFTAINILHERDDLKLFEDGVKLLSSDTSLVCDASGCLKIELPINEHIKILNKQKN